MKATEIAGIQGLLLFAGAMIVAIMILLMVTTSEFFSGVKAQESNEDASLGYQLLSTVNILVINEKGNITQELVKKHSIEVLENGTLKVGEQAFDLPVYVKPITFISKKGIIVSKNDGVIEINNLV